MSETTTRSAASYDVAAVRAHFPSLGDGGAAHFDGPGGTQTPDVVARAVHDTLLSPLANRGSATPAERNADAAVVGARSALGDLLGADPGGIVFGRSMTQLTLDLARTMAKGWGPGDEVVVTRLDHDANVRTWVLAAEAVGATVRFADFDPETGELAPSQVERVITPATRLVAVTGASNLIGTMPDLPAIAEVVHAAGALFFVDAVHLAAHVAIDVAASGADFVVCSPYKFLGPHCGALAGRPEILERLDPDKLLPSPDVVPEKFELGTLPYELMAGTTAAVDFLADLAPGAARRWLAPRTDPGLDGRTRAARGPAAGPPRGGAREPARASRCTPARPVVRRRCWPRSRATTCSRSGTSWPSAASTHPPARSTPTRRRVGSASARPVAFASGWRRTPTTMTSTGCWRVWRRSSRR